MSDPPNEAAEPLKVSALSARAGPRVPQPVASSLLTVLGVAVPACALAVVGIGSIVEPFLSAQMFAAGLGVRLGNALQLARYTGGVELAIAVALCIWSMRSRLPTCAGGVVFLFLAVVVSRVLRLSPQAASCGCYGSLLGEHFARDLDVQLRLFGALVFLSLAQGLRPLTPRLPVTSISK